MTPPETFVRHYRLSNRADVVVIVGSADLTVFAATRCTSLVDELPSYQRINFANHRALAHAERPRDGVRARPTLTFLSCAGNQVGIDLELVWVQAQREDAVVDLEVGHRKFPFFDYCNTTVADWQ